MSLQPLATYPIPEETQRIARAAFPHATIYMQIADRLGNIYKWLRVLQMLLTSCSI